MTLTRRFMICNVKGLHARASARFVETAAQFDAVVTVERDGSRVNARSIMGLMMLAASKGACIDVSAEGPEAHDALDALEILVADRFGEPA